MEGFIAARASAELDNAAHALVGGAAPGDVDDVDGYDGYDGYDDGEGGGAREPFDYDLKGEYDVLARLRRSG
jgi:hypothetical protein